MSHGQDKPAEPNLVPLLDLVLQLVMFFMVCTNFVMEQLDQKVLLPTAATAKSLDRTETSLLFLNVGSTGALLPVEGGPDLTKSGDIEAYLKRKFRECLRRVEGKRDEAEKMLVIVRAHEAARFEAIHRVLKAIKQAGFKRLQLRALIG